MRADHANVLLPAGAGTATAHAWRRGNDAPHASLEAVVDEEPVALEVNGIAHAVMLVTPDDLGDFALGFLLAEGLIDGPADLLDLEVDASLCGTVIRVTVTARCEVRLKNRRRALAGRTGCGLCGIESLSQLALTVPQPVGGVCVEVSRAALARAMQRLAERQPLQQATGASHAAGWFGLDGEPVLVREDVGRHNALDKLVGALVADGTDLTQGFAAVTSRASVEMAHKAARAGIAVLAAVSAPTRLAVQLADESGLTLAGYVREDRGTVYSHPHRII